MRLTNPCAPHLLFVPSMQRLTIKTECRHFKTQKKNAWLLENKFTPRGDKEYSEVFNRINYRDFTIIILDRGDEAWK